MPCIISHSYKCIFIHISKTGGMSIANALIKNGKKIGWGGHSPCFRLHKVINEWEEYFKFCFVRNPWDRLVSGYHFLKKKNKITVPFKKWIIDLSMSIKWNKPHNNNCQLNQIMFEDELCVDFVGRFENFQRDFELICKKIDCKLPLYHINRSKHKHYSYYYDSETENIVAIWHKPDIEYFGYKFES